MGTTYKQLIVTERYAKTPAIVELRSRNVRWSDAVACVSSAGSRSIQRDLINTAGLINRSFS